MKLELISKSNIIRKVTKNVTNGPEMFTG